MGRTAPPITLCGSLSLHPVALGAAMHEAGYRALGLPYRYVPFGVTESELVGALGGMRALGIRGLGISMPFKQQVMALCDALEPLAARIGAVNTVVNDDGRLVGHNTDWTGAARALGEATPLAGLEVLVLGAGGAARAVAFGLCEAGARVTLSNRTDDKARALAEELGARQVPWNERASHRPEALVQATSLGMATGEPTSAAELPWPETAFLPPRVVMDIVYRPIETPLLRLARARGAATVHGGRMLLHQAAAQFELYTGRPAPLEAMQAALERAMAEQAAATTAG